MKIKQNQKNRVNYKNNPLRIPDRGIILFSLSNRRFETIYFLFIKKWFRKQLRKKKLFNKLSCYYPLLTNYNLTKKKKNSRMGKGNGSFLRKCIMIKKRQPILLISGIPLQSILKFRNYFLKYLNFKIGFTHNYNTQVTRPFSNIKQSLFYKKTFFL